MISKEAEQQLLLGAKKVAAYVVAGATPTEAVIKAAQELKMGEALVPRLVQSYNVGSAAHQRDACQGEGILCKLANYPIAVLEDVMTSLFPSQHEAPGDAAVKHAVHECYSKAPAARGNFYTREELRNYKPREKAASADAAPPPTIRDYQAPPLATWRKKLADAEAQKYSTHHGYMLALSAVADYFKSASPVTLDEAEFFARRNYGEKTATAIFDYVEQRNPWRTKRAGCKHTPSIKVDWQVAPFSLLDSVVKAAEDHHAACAAFKREEVEYATKMAKFTHPFAQPQTATPPSVLGHSFKQAGFWDAAMGAAAGTAASGMSQLGAKPTSQLVADTESNLTDPAHTAQLRSIRTRAMLNDFLANDNLIRGHDPDEVLMAYNEIAQVAPRAAELPAAMRPVLRRRLASGTLEPMDIQQLADLDRTLSQSRPMFTGSGNVLAA